MYKCYQCGAKSVAWQNDFDYKDFGLEGEGIVQTYKCSNCNSRITFYVPMVRQQEYQMEGQIEISDLIGEGK